jgi:hypothetical protein
MIKAREAECGQEQGKYDHQRDGQSDPSDGADGKKERDHVEPNEAAFLVFIIDEVERVEDGISREFSSIPVTL